MSKPRLWELAGAVAVHLTELTGEPWISQDSDHRTEGHLYGGGALHLTVEDAADRSKICVSGHYPPSLKSRTFHRINVAEERGAQAIAREIVRRLLPDYRAELAATEKFECEHAAQFAARAAALFEAEALFGGRTDFGSYDPAASGEARYKTSVRLELRGSRVARGQSYPSTEFARIETTGYGDLMSLNVSDIPAAVMMGMLQVLADYTAALPPKVAD
jgi:hypothetical protein